MGRLRDNWRILLLVILILASTASLFAPQVGALGGANNTTATNATATANNSGLTNLNYGLELSGGTRIRAPLVGLTAQEVPVTAQNSTNVSAALVDQLNVSVTDVQIRQQAAQTATVEVFNENVSQQQFVQALQVTGVQASQTEIRQGVTDETVETTVSVLDNKVNQAGLSGASVQTAQSNGRTYVIVEVPGATRQEVIDLIGSRGQVTIVAHYPQNQSGNYTNEPLLTRSDLASVGTVQQDQRTGQPVVPVTLTEQGAQQFAATLQQTGITENPYSCNYNQNPADAGYCLYTQTDGQVVYAASLAPSLAQSVESGGFQRDPSYETSATNISEATQLQIDLQAGALPTNLNIDAGTTQFISPSFAPELRGQSLATGMVAVIAVGGAVYARYSSLAVAGPMVLTALSEVLLLLGFAAAIGLALNLSHIAGLIAVIGTGVDDLIIIADEVVRENKTQTRRLFQRRFRKAFWVIAAAAVTTIVALSPLAVLSLGELQGFAIVTIVGVLIGIFVTRPAYGDILRRLTTSKK